MCIMLESVAKDHRRKTQEATLSVNFTAFLPNICKVLFVPGPAGDCADVGPQGAALAAVPTCADAAGPRPACGW